MVESRYVVGVAMIMMRGDKKGEGKKGWTVEGGKGKRDGRWCLISLVIVNIVCMGWGWDGEMGAEDVYVKVENDYGVGILSLWCWLMWACGGGKGKE